MKESTDAESTGMQLDKICNRFVFRNTKRSGTGLLSLHCWSTNYLLIINKANSVSA